MTKDHPHSVLHAMGNRHDYLPAAGRDALLPGYDLLTRLLGMYKLHETLVAQAELAPGQRVLEIGCGTGNLTIRAKRAQPAAELIGSDPDPLALARAERKAHGLSGIRFERAYAQELPYAEGEFDRVLSAMMLHHLETDIKTAALAEVLRVLRPGGSVHIVDVGGAVTSDDGLVARLMLHNEHAADNLGDGIPQLLRSVGFDSAVVASQRHRRLGRVTFYRGIRPI
ncbi:class I SAM-dependent methyltransferase [Nocardia sp. NPDC005998]|uniref:class I SAM-dependent methyltransferase n=1 Tax=Nocardia sp. NPDC005998 TaxID=3156894 RepID=UPI0033B0DFBA